MTACEVHPLSCDQKIVCAKNSSINDDHGERCHHSGPFLKSMPITWHQNYMKLCGEVSYNLFVLCQRTRKMERHDQMVIFHEKWELRSQPRITDLHATQCFCILQSEVHPDFFFTGMLVGGKLQGYLPQRIIPREIWDYLEHGGVHQDGIILHRILSK
jgi:hypothetical protein